MAEGTGGTATRDERTIFVRPFVPVGVRVGASESQCALALPAPIGGTVGFEQTTATALDSVEGTRQTKRVTYFDAQSRKDHLQKFWDWTYSLYNVLKAL